jgi:hypothetical protein
MKRWVPGQSIGRGSISADADAARRSRGGASGEVKSIVEATTSACDIPRKQEVGRTYSEHFVLLTRNNLLLVCQQ